jgi:hypothetical protein
MRKNGEMEKCVEHTLHDHLLSHCEFEFDSKTIAAEIESIFLFILFWYSLE